MKQPENNEIDSLLRSWGGRRRSVSAGLAGNGAGAHLDVDELNAYAEGALPPATRARYTAHLADCDDCRHFVTSLAIAAGPIVKETPTGQPSERAGWLKALAVIFTPPVLRFALPALLLVAVGVAFFTSRRSNDNASVAMKTQSEKTQSESKPAAELSPASQPNSGYVAKAPLDGRTAGQPQPQPTTAGDVAANKSAEEAEKKAEAKTDTISVNDKAEVSKDAPKEATRRQPEPVAAEKGAVGQPSMAAPPPAAPGTSVTGATKDAVGGKGEYVEAKNAEARKRQAKTVDEVASASPQSAGRDDDRQKAKIMKADRAREDRNEETATRDIAGRHFQQRNGAWVDTAYKSSMSTVNMARGSEQYRALVADEPEIDVIARQLGGEVFVVWKGRAYHIK